VGHLAREAAAAQLLLVDMAKERAGVGRARDDADLGDAAEVFEFVYGGALLEEAYTPARNCASPVIPKRRPRLPGARDLRLRKAASLRVAVPAEG